VRYENQLKATRGELKQALIAHLSQVIDDNIEYWVEQDERGITVRETNDDNAI